MVNFSDQTRTGAFMAVWSVTILLADTPALSGIIDFHIYKIYCDTAQARTGDLLRVKQM